MQGTQNFFPRIPLKSKNFLFATFVEDMKSLGAVEDDFASRDKSKFRQMLELPDYHFSDAEKKSSL